MDDHQFQFELFTGDANPAIARVYARLKLNDIDQSSATELKITGRLTGPACEFAQTLSARIPFVELRGTGTSKAEVIAEAVVPDPCFWTPELPNLYRAQLEIVRDGATIENIERLCGIRRWGVRGRSLLFEGKRFVLRGVGFGTRSVEERRKWEGGRRNEEGRMQIADCRLQNADWKSEADEQFARESWTAVVLDNPSDEVCERASRRGAMLIADLSTLSSGRGQGEGEELSNGSAIQISLQRLAQWPAVMNVILSSEAAIDDSLRRAIPNLLLAQFISVDQPLVPAPWAQVALVEASDPSEFARRVENCPLPVIAVRPSEQFVSIETGRGACDYLQRDLAPCGDFAGYVV